MISNQLDLNVALNFSKIDFDGIIAVLVGASDGKLSQSDLLKNSPDDLRQPLGQFLTKRKFEFKVGSNLSFDLNANLRYSFQLLDSDAGMFSWLTSARQILAHAVIDPKVKHLVVDLRGCGKNSPDLADAYVSAIAASLYKFPKYEGVKPTPAKKTKADPAKSKQDLVELTIIADKQYLNECEKRALGALTVTTSGTNLVRWLAKRAGNDLTCKSYLSYLKQLSAERKWKYEHIDHAKLVSMKAGGFLAVVKGSEHQDYGIAKLTYSPPKAKKHLVLVGKGLVFDTGGHNLKTTHMLGMHGDMAGSAVAASILNVATLEKWPIKITAFLAIADNMIGPKSYKPNDVVTTMNGTTIEVIDTDAEGRMVLSDTLSLAAKESPDLMMDFATLTGACVRAIGTTFSGVFSNRPIFNQSLIEAGYSTGERVWPFPMDKDFADCLDSTSADTKQCREKGGVDHIEASQFLMKFAGKEVPWVHVDLSAIENPGGLAHVSTDETGFGVRFASDFARRVLKF